MKKAIEGWQKKKIYAIANQLNYVVKGQGDDPLHMIMYTMTSKSSTKDLTYGEAQDLISYLLQQQALNEKKNGVTSNQKKKIWALMYELKAQDIQSDPTPIGERLIGIIKRQFDVITSPQRPFTHLTYEDGEALIEILKHYVKSAERKRMS